MNNGASIGVAILALFSALMIAVVFFFFGNQAVKNQQDFYQLDSYSRYLPQ